MRMHRKVSYRCLRIGQQAEQGCGQPWYRFVECDLEDECALEDVLQALVQCRDVCIGQQTKQDRLQHVFMLVRMRPGR